MRLHASRAGVALLAGASLVASSSGECCMSRLHERKRGSMVSAALYPHSHHANLPIVMSTNHYTYSAFSSSAAESIASRTPALAQCRHPAPKSRAAAGMPLTMAESRGVLGDLGKMASALALSALLVLPSPAAQILKKCFL
jgi:hypothetical protein